MAKVKSIKKQNKGSARISANPSVSKRSTGIPANPSKSKRRKTPVKFTKAQFIKALAGTGGIAKQIAYNLDCARVTVYKWLKDAPDDILEALHDEIDSIGDVAENTVMRMMTQRLDFGVAARTAKWYLERKCTDRGYKERKELILEGGKTPFHVKNESVLPLDSLNLPIETRKQILAAMEEAEEGDDADGND